MKLQNLHLYFFSGTGNSQQAAQWVADDFRSRNVLAQVTNIAEIDRKLIETPAENSIIGFCSPTHGFNYPPVMVNFIMRFPKAKYRNPIFLMNTRAGLKMHKLFIPGLSGVALLFAALMLRLKGYRIVGMQSVDLPSNWISLHPGVRQVPVESMFRRLHKICGIFVQNLFTKGKSFRVLRSLPFDLAVAPIALLYYFAGRFILAKTFYASGVCTNCQICVKQCPVKAIKLIDNRPFWKITCESCMHCMNVCPERAIETAHGYLIGSFIFVSAILQWLLFGSSISATIPGIGKLYTKSGLVEFMIESSLLIIFIIISYYLIHFLKKYWLFDKLLRLTSLTSIKFWRRYTYGIKIAGKKHQAKLIKEV